jgi:hypothetical protein
VSPASIRTPGPEGRNGASSSWSVSWPSREDVTVFPAANPQGLFGLGPSARASRSCPAAGSAPGRAGSCRPTPASVRWPRRGRRRRPDPRLDQLLVPAAAATRPPDALQADPDRRRERRPRRRYLGDVRGPRGEHPDRARRAASRPHRRRASARVHGHHERRIDAHGAPARAVELRQRGGRAGLRLRRGRDPAQQRSGLGRSGGPAGPDRRRRGEHDRCVRASDLRQGPLLPRRDPSGRADLVEAGRRVEHDLSAQRHLRRVQAVLVARSDGRRRIDGPVVHSGG